MMKLYSAPTPNGNKVAIALEELKLPYDFVSVDLSKREQKTPDFLAMNPNGKIPVLLDPEGDQGQPLAIAESGAILIYLAEKTRSDLLPAEGAARSKVLEWLMFQMSSIGATFGQLFFLRLMAPEPNPSAEERFQAEADRLIRVMDDQLSRHTFIAGNTYSIADIALFPWMLVCERLSITLDDAPNLVRWRDTVGEREAVKRGMTVGSTAS